MKEKIKYLSLVAIGIVITLAVTSLGTFSSLMEKLSQYSQEKLEVVEEKFSPEEKAIITLSFSPEKETLIEGETLEVKVLVKSEKEIIAADIDLVFDPQYIILKEVSPGNLWSQPQEATKVIDNQKGKALYGVLTLEPKAQGGILASFKFQAKKATPSLTNTQVSFQPGTTVAIKGEEPQLDISASGEYAILIKGR